MLCGFKSRPRYQDMIIRRFLRRIRRALAYNDPLITVGISKENLLHNLHTYQQAHPGLRIAPVLKSNAYGHGLAVVAELLDKEDIAFFMVDSLYEARRLRRAGIRSRILVMGYVRPEYIADSSLRKIDYALTDIEQLKDLALHAHKSVRVHLKIDTGMHRQGILPSDLPETVRFVQANPHIRVVGVGTHLADADNSETAFSETQLNVWNEAVRTLEAAFPNIEYRHAAATKGVRFDGTYPMNTARVGMGLYGCDTSPTGDLPLKPVLELRSFVTSIRTIPEGDFVGYNATFRASRPSRIATIPVGYFEGVDRTLSNVGSFMIAGTSCPIAGRVSMNMTSIDVTDVPNVARGDTAIVISRDTKSPNSVQNMAKLANTSPYVILAHIPEHLRRVVE